MYSCEVHVRLRSVQAFDPLRIKIQWMLSVVMSLTRFILLLFRLILDFELRPPLQNKSALRNPSERALLLNEFSQVQALDAGLIRARFLDVMKRVCGW
jgi:hypothetical protein